MATSIEEFDLSNVHSETKCSGRTCIMHSPTSHHMRDWTLHWRGDRGLFERICRHGVGHPDPDQGDYWSLSNQDYMWVHGCCGCCIAGEL
jgi:hypothetical protein